MNRTFLLASIAAVSFAFAPVFADDLNPQPEPPGVHAKVNAMGAAHANAMMSASTVHKLPPGPCAPQMNTMSGGTMMARGNTMSGGTMSSHMTANAHCSTVKTNTIGSATGGAGAGKSTVGSATGGAGSGRVQQ